MMQRVPYMVVVPGMDKGKMSDTYAGQVDMLPTLEHLLGIDSKTPSGRPRYAINSAPASQHSDPAITLSLQNTLASTDEPTYTQTGEEITNQMKPSRKNWMRFTNCHNTQLKMVMLFKPAT